MNATQWAAWVGALGAVANACWNIYAKSKEGPCLVLTAYPDMIFMPTPPGDPKHVSVTVHNVGTLATTLTNLTLQTYDSKWKQRRRKATGHFVVINYQGPALTYKLEVGTQWQALVKQDERLDALLADDKVWCAVWHTFSKRPVETKIPKLRPPIK
jgi:hypothetical protein